MEVTVEQLNVSSEQFSKLLGLASVPPNIKVRLARIGAIIEAESKIIGEQRLELFKKYGKPVDGKGEWTMEGADAESLASFNSTARALMAEKIPLPGTKIKAEFLANVPELNGLDYLRLGWLIDTSDEVETSERKLAAVK